MTLGYDGSEIGMNALKPGAPSCHWALISGRDGSVSAPQSPKSTTTFWRAISRFWR